MSRRGSNIIIGVVLGLIALGAFLYSRQSVPVVPMPEPEQTFGAAATTVSVTDTFLTDGTWTAPAGVTSVLVKAIGGGGGGTDNTGAGGGGAFASGSFTVIPGNAYTITVGSASANVSADDSTFDGASLSADGGLSGGAGCTGGTVANSIGTARFAGGNGSCGIGTRYAGGAGGEGADGTNGSSASTGKGVGAFAGGGQTLAGGLYGAGGRSGAGVATAGARGVVFVTYNAPLVANYPSVQRVRASRNITSGATSYTVLMPEGIVSGDLLVTIFSHGDNGDNTPSVGWTELASSSQSGVISQFVYYKRATGGDSLTVTSVGSELSGAVTYVIKDAGIPEATQATGTSTNANPPLHTPSGGSANYLWMATAAWDSSAGISVTAFPTNYGSKFFMGANGATNNTALQATSQRNANGSSEDPGTFTSGSEEWVATTISIPYLCQSDCPTPAPAPQSQNGDIMITE